MTQTLFVQVRAFVGWLKFLSRFGMAGFAIAALMSSAIAQEKPMAKVTLSLDFNPLGRHAPWYAALAEGYFREEGLDVSIIPSQGTAQTVQAVESGLANIAFVDVPSVVLARANGSKLKMVAVNYQKAPYAIFSLSNGANVTEPKQLEGLTLGSGAGSFTPKVIAGFMAQKGLDPGKLKITNIAPAARASAVSSSASAKQPGGYINPDDTPMAPCAHASRTREHSGSRAPASSGRGEMPSTASRVLPKPTRQQKFSAQPARSSAAKNPSKSVHESSSP